jgi:hypothetical protein
VRNRFAHLLPVLDYLGALFWIFGLLVLAPLIVLGVYGSDTSGETPKEVSIFTFVVPAAIAFALALVLKRKAAFGPCCCVRWGG